MSEKRLVSIRRIVLNIIVLFLVGSLTVEVVMGYYLKKEALTSLALEDARHTSELVFENLYTKMQEGWSKKDIEKILARLNRLRDGMEVKLYRSPLVEALYGPIPGEKEKIAKDPLIKEAMEGREIIRLMADNRVRYLYPVKVQKRCLQCHRNAKAGDVNGVIDISLPARQIVVSLDKMILYFIVALGIFLLGFFLFFYWMFDKRLVRPLVQLSRQISERRQWPEAKRQIRVESECKELKTLENAFNTLMRKIRYYYDKLLENMVVDQLTGLYNINRLKNDLEKMQSASMLLLNIDRFKELNDYYGFEMGDRVLSGIAAHLRESLDGEVTLYRVGGSEFALVRQTPFEITEVLEILADLHALTYESPTFEELRISLTAGVVIGQNDRLIEKASIALNAAKQRNKPFEFYRNAKELEIDYKRHIRWMKEVDDAIEEDRVIIHYQPIRKVSDATQKRYEALVRIVGRDGRVHMPGEFLDVVQHSRLYAKLTSIVLQKTFRNFKESACCFSVNLSINDIKDPLCRNHVYTLLREFPRPGHVTFEILESEEVGDFELMNDFIRTVHALGAKVAIDDFGSGYSNFHYLLKMKADYFKIDASLIRHLHEDADSRMLVESIIQFAGKLGVETVAEYVENEEIAKMCVKLGVDYLQGYYIGEPGPVAEGC